MEPLDIELGLGASEKEKGNAARRAKPMHKSTTSVCLKYFEANKVAKIRKCKFCSHPYAITTSTGNLSCLTSFPIRVRQMLNFHVSL